MKANKRKTVYKMSLEKTRKIDWNKYASLRGLNMTNGVDPAEHIRKMREDRE